MEFLADSGAILRGMEVVASSVNPFIAVSHLRQFGVAVGINLLIAEVVTQDSSNTELAGRPPLSSHPSAALRLGWCEHLVSEEYFDPTWPSMLDASMSLERARRAVKEGIQQARSAWDALGWRRANSPPDHADASGLPIAELLEKLVPPEGFDAPKTTL